MEQATQQQATNQNVTLEQAIAHQKQQALDLSKTVHGTLMNVIETWAHNFTLSDAVKNTRTEQLNFVLGFINQIASEGVKPLLDLGNKVKDPELSNEILECNNTLMTVANNILQQVQESEQKFKVAMQQKLSQQKATTSTAETTENSNKTEVSYKEA